MTTNLQKLRGLLQELFQLDQADLDFGIYRIMNTKRDEVIRFLDKDLLPQVQEAFKQYKPADKANLQAELNKLEADVRNAGMNPDDSPKVKELRHRIDQSAVDITSLENEVFSHLYNFFRRYYSEGDFISLRRYKEGVYAIPYEGEEVKLHWANADQYYIKSAETFRDYTFKIESGKRVRVHLIAANTEQDNNKPASGNERRFVLSEDEPLREENGELFIRFEYRPCEGKEKQTELNQIAIDKILKTRGFEKWGNELCRKAPTDKNPNRTLLEKHLSNYTARNTFDYFIHKNLGGFLRREFDFYIKNEVMHLDDIQDESSIARVEQYLSLIKVLRTIASKIILFLEQLENFQKKLWLKKKFIVETNYCITLDRVPTELYAEIAQNKAQCDEWIRLFAIDEIEKDITQPGYSSPPSVEFLKAHPYLMVDTCYFESRFKDRILSGLHTLDDNLDGLLIHGENFQALSALHNRYSGAISCVYIDPPYNTDASAILYKNDYKDSSWMSLLADRLQSVAALMSPQGVICVAIDDEEVVNLRPILSSVFRKQIGIAVVRANPQSRKTKGSFSPVHEYALFFGKSEEAIPGSLEATEKKLERYPHNDANGPYAWMNFIRTGSNDKRSDRPRLYYPILVDPANKLRIAEMEWSASANEWVLLEKPKVTETVVYPVAERNGTRIEKNWHRGHQRVISDPDEYRVRRSEDGKISIDFKTRMDESATPSTWWDQKEYASANYGAAQLKDMFGDKPFDFPKAQGLVADCLRAAGATDPKCTVIDFFAGSGTTGHSVISLNRDDAGSRRYILVEAGHHFDAVVIPRVKKAVFSNAWKDGKPQSREGVSHTLKYIRLESYEDCLNNLELQRSPEQGSLLQSEAGLREQYVLSYMLDVESRESSSLFNAGSLRRPDDYKLRVERNGETNLVDVDLVETFNWLLGLTVRHIDLIQGVRVVDGISPKGNRVLVLWRNLDEMDSDNLDQWFEKQGYSSRDLEYDLIYVNGDNNLENLCRPDQSWKVRLIEEHFEQLMFASPHDYI